MAGTYNEGVAREAKQGDVSIVATAWRPLTASGTGGITTGTTPLSARRHIRYNIKSNPGGALAVEYVARNQDGTFTTPTTSVKLATVFPGNTTVVEPIGDSIQVYGRLVAKKGFTFSSIRVIVTEFA